MSRKKIAVIGSTGSIGRNTLAVVRSHPDRFQIVALLANGDVAGLARQISEFSPRCAAINDRQKTAELRALVGNHQISIFSGDTGLTECLQECGAEICVSAAAGIAGLLPTLAAIDCGMQIALANKESLVAAGKIVMQKAAARGVKILPIDSEHSAIAQCLRSGGRQAVRKIIITASGGALANWSADQLATVTPAIALKHPTWAMGKKITIDSATLANKALEAIEAHFLFDLAYHQIEIVIHPQSILHGAVEFSDGSLIAQLAPPNMQLPILYALSEGERCPGDLLAVSLTQIANLSFAAPDYSKYPLLEIGISAGCNGGLAPAVFSAANEAAVELFLAEKIRYPQVATLVAAAVRNIGKTVAAKRSAEFSLENILAADYAARQEVLRLAHS